MAERISAPLGSGRARYAPGVPALTDRAHTELRDWFSDHPDSYVAVSGGKDSMVSLHLAAAVQPGVRAVWFDSRLEFPQTRPYLERMCAAWGTPLTVIEAEQDPLDLMVENGTWSTWTENDLSDPDAVSRATMVEPLRKAQETISRASVYGMRADESVQRKMLYAKNNGRATVTVKGVVVQHYFAPIWRWSFAQVMAYAAMNRVELHPLYAAQERLGVRYPRMGTVIDATGLERGRWFVARQLAPDLARRIEARLPRLAEDR